MLYDKKETDKVCSLLFRAVSNGHPAMSPKFVGQPAKVGADAAQFGRNQDFRWVINPGVGEKESTFFWKTDYSF